MDKAISASEANQHFSEMLRAVQQGESYVVLSRGRAVARLVPVDEAEGRRSVGALLDYLETVPRRHGGRWKRADLYD